MYDLLCLFLPNSQRHPQSSSRPTPGDILLALMENEDAVLRIPKDDVCTNNMATVLGAPLKAGQGMYPDLQTLYYSSPQA